MRTSERSVSMERTKCIYVPERESWRGYSLCRAHRPCYVPFGGRLICWSCMIPRHDPEVVVIWVPTRWFKGNAYFVRDASGHGSNEDNTTSIAEPEHLLPGRLSRIQDTICVDVHDLHAPVQSMAFQNSKKQPTSLNCSAGYVKQSVWDFNIPAAATQTSILFSRSPISCALRQTTCWSRTSTLTYSNLDPLFIRFTYSSVFVHSSDGLVGRSKQ